MEKIPLPALSCGLRQNVGISCAMRFNQIKSVSYIFILEALQPESPFIQKENQSSIHENS